MMPPTLTAFRKAVQPVSVFDAPLDDEANEP
jgi:hypothetical protein